MFNAEKAQEFLLIGDRDIAPYFVGREREISAFDDCLVSVRYRMEQDIPASSMIRIYQGAPGCGKTSLVNHLKDTHDAVLFIEMSPSSLTDVEGFKSHAIDELHRAENSGFHALKGIGTDALTSVKFNNTARMLASFLQSISEIPPIVIYVDEAQILNATHGACLLDIYRGVAGLPLMLLLTGLTYTEESIISIQGLSRLPADSVINMSKLSDDECLESTFSLMADLDVEGDAAKQNDAAEFVTSMAYGWPQHLHVVQTALCRELLRTRGQVSRIDYETLARDSDSMRSSYYAARLRATVLEEEPRLTAAAATTVANMDDVGLAKLEHVCSVCLEIPGLVERDPANYDPVEIAQTLVRKGVIAKNDSGSYEPSIPSMVTWLQKKNNLPPDFSIAAN